MIGLLRREERPVDRAKRAGRQRATESSIQARSRTGNRQFWRQGGPKRSPRRDCLDLPSTQGEQLIIICLLGRCNSLIERAA